MTTSNPAYKRILLKLSGEALMGDDQFGINRDTIVRIVNEVVAVTRLGVEVAVVIGGGISFAEWLVDRSGWIVLLLITWACWLR